MNRDEAVTLWRLAKAAKPHQAFDEYTPDAWALTLDDIRFEDAKAAVVRLAKAQAFIDVAEIRTEVKRIREKRLAEHPEPTPPPDLTPQQTIEWLRETRRAIADGNPPDVPALDARPRDMAALAGTFKRMPEAG